MTYRILADAVVAIHFAFVIFVVGGGLLVLRCPRVALVHVPAAAWGVLIEFMGWVCPLTPLEQALRLRGGQAGYQGGFIEHYILPILYPSGLTREMQVVLGTLALAVNLLLYWMVWRRLRRRT